jgi:hypothetical protein
MLSTGEESAFERRQSRVFGGVYPELGEGPQNDIQARPPRSVTTNFQRKTWKSFRAESYQAYIMLLLAIARSTSFANQHANVETDLSSDEWIFSRDKPFDRRLRRA